MNDSLFGKLVEIQAELKALREEVAQQRAEKFARDAVLDGFIAF
jgi:hypothetical protein